MTADILIPELSSIPPPTTKPNLPPLPLQDTIDLNNQGRLQPAEDGVQADSLGWRDAWGNY